MKNAPEMKQLNCLYTLFFGVFWSIGDFALNITPIMVKFAVMGLIVPIVAIYMLYDDDNSENPSNGQVFITLLTSLLFVWISYEITIEWKIPGILGMILSFAIGLSALPIIRVLKNEVPKAVADIVKAAGDWVKGRFK